jgi:hypothetical protein
MKITESITLPDGYVIPANSELTVSKEGYVSFDGKLLDIYKIPSSIIEPLQIQTKAIKSLSYNDIHCGYSGFDEDGNVVTVLDKFETGKDYDSTSFAELLSNLDNCYGYVQREIDSFEGKQFVVVTDGLIVKLLDFKDVTIFRSPVTNFNDLEIGQSISLESNVMQVLSKCNTAVSKKMPSWLTSLESHTPGNKYLLVKDTNGAINIIDFDNR